MMIWLLKAYQHALKAHPIRTAALSAGTLMTTGDAIAQIVVEKKKLSQFELKRSLRFVIFGTFLAKVGNSTSTLLSAGDVLAQLVVEKRPVEMYNIKRTIRFAIFGTFFGGPMFSVWYSGIARKFGHTRFAPLKMVACDQLLFAPPFIAYFLIVMELLKGEGWRDIKLKLQDDYGDVMKTNYKIWPAVQALNFTFVPVHYRVVTVNFVAVGWNTYLAWMSEKSNAQPVTNDDEETTNEQTPSS